MKKQSNLSKLIGYAEGHKKLTVLGCILSGVAAILGLVPYVCVWLVARDALSSTRMWNMPVRMVSLGLDGGLVCSGKYCGVFAALMCTHIAAFRTARNIRHTGVAHVMRLPLGFSQEISPDVSARSSMTTRP